MPPTPINDAGKGNTRKATAQCMSASEQNDRARNSWGSEIAFYLQLAVSIWLRIAFLFLRSMVLLAGEGEFLGYSVNLRF